MKKYIALLRGINVSGKNTIPMGKLKESFEKFGYENVTTYINSGNVVFSTHSTDRDKISAEIASMMKNQFGFDVPIMLIEPKDLEKIFENAPEWWGNADKEIYDNLIFIIPPTTFDEVFSVIGEAKKEYEKISNFANVIYWSFIKKDYSKTNWIKTADSKINDKVTMRTANTMRKVLALAKKEDERKT